MSFLDDDPDPVADAINNLATQIKYLGNGDASTSMGGMEALGLEIKNAGSAVAAAIHDLAAAQREVAFSNNELAQALIDSKNKALRT